MNFRFANYDLFNLCATKLETRIKFLRDTIGMLRNVAGECTNRLSNVRGLRESSANDRNLRMGKGRQRRPNLAKVGNSDI